MSRSNSAAATPVIPQAAHYGSTRANFPPPRDIVPDATYGRKERCTPLTRHTVGVLRAWLAELGHVGDRAAVPHPPGRHRSARLHRRSPRPARRRARQHCPSLDGQERDTAHPAPHRRHDPARRRRRHRRHRALARPRAGRHHPDLPARRPHQKERPSPAPRHPAPQPAATSHPTRSSPSSKPSDCSDLATSYPPAPPTERRPPRNNHDLGTIGDLLGADANKRVSPNVRFAWQPRLPPRAASLAALRSAATNGRARW